MQCVSERRLCYIGSICSQAAPGTGEVCIALRDLRKDPDDFDANVNMDDCERFFRSVWCETIISVDPEILMKKLQKEAGFDGIQQM